MPRPQTIALGYIGVHQAFQLAAAAEDAGVLEWLACSLVDAPGKWGRWLARWVQSSALKPAGLDLISPERIREVPLPMLTRRFAKWLPEPYCEDYLVSNAWFDREVAAMLHGSSARLFVGVESCALRSLETAKVLGMKTMLDCPGIPVELLEREVTLARQDMGLPTTDARRDGGGMAERRAAERETADILTVCSETVRQHYCAAGIDARKLVVNPLWVDSAFERMPARQPNTDLGRPLRVLFVGAPYALLAMEHLGDRAQLTFCGGVDATVRAWAGNKLGAHTVLGWRPRSALPEVYAAHDVLIFPTLGDSFGFVAVEAMACGLPVIATTQAGAPLPDESWRVPPRDSEALAQSILRYANDRDLLQRDSRAAQEFSHRFTPASFRERARAIFSELLPA